MSYFESAAVAAVVTTTVVVTVRHPSRGDVISKICRYLLAHSICGVIRGRKSIQIKKFHLASFSRPPRTPLGT